MCLRHQRLQGVREVRAFGLLGLGGGGFGLLGFWGLGFRVWGFRGLGLRAWRLGLMV